MNKIGIEIVLRFVIKDVVVPCIYFLEASEKLSLLIPNK